jgi:hypothetical protein
MEFFAGEIELIPLKPGKKICDFLHVGYEVGDFVERLRRAKLKLRRKQCAIFSFANGKH